MVSEYGYILDLEYADGTWDRFVRPSIKLCLECKKEIEDENFKIISDFRICKYVISEEIDKEDL